MPQDYDGDGKTDVAITRSSAPGRYWFILQSRDGLRIERFGSNGDTAALGDYDGDGKADLAVARPGGGTYTFFIQRSTDGNWMTGTLGDPNGDVLAPGDYDGDGKTDMAVLGHRGDFQSFVWRWIRSSDGVQKSLKWGNQGDQAAAGDYDGDGKTDIAIYRALPCNAPANFWINGSTAGLMIVPFGTCGYSAIEFYL